LLLHIKLASVQESITIPHSLKATNQIQLCWRIVKHSILEVIETADSSSWCSSYS